MADPVNLADVLEGAGANYPDLYDDDPRSSWDLDPTSGGRDVTAVPLSSWLPCEQPERPMDAQVVLCPPADLCAGCVIAAEAALAAAHGWCGEYLDLVGECEAEAGRPAVSGRPDPEAVARDIAEDALDQRWGGHRWVTS